METIKTIEEFIIKEMDGKIQRKSQSPWPPIAIMLAGVALFVFIEHYPMHDSLLMLLLTASVTAMAVGIVFIVLSLTGTMSHYVYTPTRSKIKLRRLYLTSDDYNHCREALEQNTITELQSLQPVVSSNAALRIVFSRDLQVALLQAGRYDTGHFAPETAVRVLFGTEVDEIKGLCK